MKRGEIWWADLPAPLGRRLVLLLSRNDAYNLLNSAITAPLTTRLRRTPTLVRLTPDEDDVPELCAVSVDNMQVVRQSRLDRFVTALSEEKMLAVDKAIHFALGLRE